MIDDAAADGEVTRHDGLAVIRFERQLAQAADEVWSALTDPDRLSRWWGEVTIEPRLGGPFDVRWFNRTPEGERFTMHATITAFDPPHLLETSGDAHGVLRWELTPEPGGTRLVFTSTLELPEEYRTRTLAGWHFHLMALRHTLDGGRVDLAGLPEWEAIHARYVARHG
ncbi:MAG: SRPBCC family protein [Acidimicrobiales bacterium]